ncbi:unnamed protein product [Prorocentrum cordatum]|uniref:Uncharacterized protein n=1 Tax=Prorocentrum cordatum TaxID=2364126 RepID=A0ABN9Q8B4_9DINO|nr:unnamed protein product [Polarella glacialis]
MLLEHTTLYRFQARDGDEPGCAAPPPPPPHHHQQTQMPVGLTTQLLDNRTKQPHGTARQPAPPAPKVNTELDNRGTIRLPGTCGACPRPRLETLSPARRASPCPHARGNLEPKRFRGGGSPVHPDLRCWY